MEDEIHRRKTAFETLVREISKKLSKADMDEMEVSEGVPEGSREKGGRKLLEYLQRQGKFSLWRTSRLRRILKECERYDLAENEVKNYQLLFPDLESPLISRRSLTSSSLPPSLSSSPRTRRPRSSPAAVRRRPRKLSFNHFPLAHEVHSSTGSQNGSARGLGSFSSSSSRGSSRDKLSLTADNSPMPSSCLRQSSVDHGQQQVEIERSRLAIQALLQIATGSSRSSLCSESSGASCSTTDSGDEQKRGRSLSATVADEYKCDETLTASTLSRLISQPRELSGEDTDASPSDPEQGKNDNSFPHTNVSISQDQPSNPPSPSTPQSNETTTSPSNNSVLPHLPEQQTRDLIGLIKWQVKRDRLLKCLSRVGEGRLQSITCSQKIDLDVGQGRNNPKLSLVLFPRGLFENVGLSASLQAKISTPDKCPPLPSSLLVHLRLVVYGSHKQEAWRKTCVQQPVNMHSFYVHHLFSCNITPETIGDHILLEISVSIKN